MKRKNINSIKNKIYNSIFQDIIHNEFDFNSYLTEKELMEKYNVSRAPIREALMQLRSDQIISSIPRHGYKIRKPDLKELREIVNYRSILECTFLEQHYHMITPEDINDLRLICKQYNSLDNQSDFITYWDINKEFHTKLFSCYENDFAMRSLNEAINKQVIYFVEIMMNYYYLASDLHIAMLDYLEKGNIHTAKVLLQADIEKMPTNIDLLCLKK